MARLQMSYKFLDTELQAKVFCERENQQYPWRKNKAHYTPWSSADNKVHKFVAFYYN